TAERPGDRVRYPPLASHPRRAAARRVVGLVAEREQRPGPRGPRRVRRRGSARHGLLARGPLRHARPLPATLTPETVPGDPPCCSADEPPEPLRMEPTDERRGEHSRDDT